MAFWYYREVKTVSLKLPEQLDARLEARARRAGKSKSAITREALVAFLDADEATRPSSLAVVRDLVGVASGPPDLASNKKRLRGYGK